MNGSGEAPRDLVPLAVKTIGFCVAFGTAIMTAFLLANRYMVLDMPVTASARPEVNQPAATMLIIGAMATLVLPALTGWMLLSPVDVLYRRFGFAMVSGLGSILVSLVSVPLNEMFGIGGLIGLLAAAILASLYLGFRVTRERAAL